LIAVYPAFFNLAALSRLSSGRLDLTTVGESSRQDQEEDHRYDAAHYGVDQDPRHSVASNAIPVVEAQSNVARLQNTRATVSRDPELPGLDEIVEQLPPGVDLYTIFALTDRNEH